VPSPKPGEGRYAHVEREQRWLLGSPPGERHDPVEIVDRYLTGTRLRLRLTRAEDGVVRKLGQKVRRAISSPEVISLTTIYLSEEEYAVLADLDASELVKTRWRWTAGGRTLTVDIFHGCLEGLVLAEVELGVDEDRLAMPEGAVADVTDDNRYAGGALAALDARRAADLLATEPRLRP
jgi:CYTH domain-containing protein